MNESDQIWHKTLLPINATIKDAINVLNDASLKIVLVVDKKGKLEGTILDGDIRRGLLKGLDLSSPIELIIHRDALVVPPEMGRNLVMQLMTANKIQQIPIVDKQQHLIGLHLWDEIYKPEVRANTMVIMAGGKGTRLHPQTENCPKPLLPVAGKPILEHIIDRAKVEGFSHFVLAIYYLGHMIEDYFGNGERFGVKIEYLREQAPLGTAGALSLLDPIPHAPFVVTNGDVITDIRYGELLEFHQQNGEKAEFVESADSINHAMPKYVAGRALGMVDSSIRNPKVLLLGVAYKPGVGDVRETPVSELRDQLIAQGADVAWHDPLVPIWEGTEPVNLDWECDVAILATNQPGMQVEKLLKKRVKILDCTNSLKDLVGVISL